MNKKETLTRRSRDEWRAIIAAQEASGESVPTYCRQRQLSEKSFYGWRKRIAPGLVAKPEEFIEVRAGNDPAKVLNIHVPGGYRVEVPEGMAGAHVQAVLRALAAL